MPELRPHGYGVERQTQDVDSDDRAQQRVGIGERVSHGIELSVPAATLPDDRVRITRWSHVGGLEHPFQQAKEVAAVGCGAGDREQIEHVRNFLHFS